MATRDKKLWPAPPDISKVGTLREVVELQKERSEEFTQVVGVKRGIELLEEARDNLIVRLTRLPKGKFTSVHFNSALIQLNAVIETLVNKQVESADGLFDATIDLGVESALRQIQWAEQEFTDFATPIPLTEAAKLAQTDETKRSVMRAFERSMQRYGLALVDEMEREMSLKLLEQVSVDEAITDLARLSREHFDDARWKAERIYRTENANTYEAARLDGARSARDNYDLKLKKMLVAVRDNRTADDSKFVDGQTRELDEPFEDDKGRRYMHPPNRPNDRETVVMVDEEWGDVRDQDIIAEEK